MIKPKIIFEGGTAGINPQSENPLEKSFLERNPVLEEQGQHTREGLYDTVSASNIDQRIRNIRIFENMLGQKMEYGVYNALVACRYNEEQINKIMGIAKPIFIQWVKDVLDTATPDYEFRRYFYEHFETIFADNMSHAFFNLIAENPRIRRQDIDSIRHTYSKLFLFNLSNTHSYIKKLYNIEHIESGGTDKLNMRVGVN